MYIRHWPTYLVLPCHAMHACSAVGKELNFDGGNDADRLWSFKEVHIMHTFHHDFYGARMNLLICGFIRPEYDYVSKESLIEDINVDIEVAKRSLEREAYLELKEERYLLEFGGEGHENEVAS